MHFSSPPLPLFLASLPEPRTTAEQMNNIHDSTASIQRVTVVLLCPPELLVALVKISSLLLQLFGSSSPRVPIILEGNIYLSLLRLAPFLFPFSTGSLISLLSLCIIHKPFSLLVRNYISKANNRDLIIWTGLSWWIWSVHATWALSQTFLGADRHKERIYCRLAFVQIFSISQVYE